MEVPFRVLLFQDLKPGNVVCWNPQMYARRFNPRHYANFHSQCLMRITRLGQGKDGPEIGLLCRSHLHYPGHQEHAVKPLPKRVLESNVDYKKGSLLIRYDRKNCHKCGNFSYHVAQLSTNHHLCIVCISNERIRPPFPYGTGNLLSCCNSNGCGKDKKKVSRKILWEGYKIIRDLEKAKA